jgi:purine-binding chemotaxis protein CheW
MEAVAESVSEQREAPAITTEAWRATAGKFLTFSLGDEEYGVDILKVVEIIGVLDVTAVPHTPTFVEGVINLRGKVIPVIDLRTRFGLPRVPYNEQTCIIVVDVGMLTGIVVDTVQEVHDIPSEDIEPPPSLGDGAETNLILGMGKIKEDVKILLDIDCVLNTEDLVQLPWEDN